MRDYLGLPSLHGFCVSWRNMHSRCYDASNNRYKNYGGRGIKVDPRWHVFSNFHADMFAAWAPGLQLDRINLNDNYYPSNCRWVTLAENSRRRTSSKLTAEQVVEIQNLFRPGAAYQRELGARYGVSSRMIRYIGAGEAWKK